MSRGFKYKSTFYENIYEWVRLVEGTDEHCFYCGAGGEMEVKFFNGHPEGVCPGCVKNFSIGCLATDRHLLRHLQPEFKSYIEARNWLTKKGAKLTLDTILDLGDREKCYCYVNKDSYDSQVQISNDGNIHYLY